MRYTNFEAIARRLEGRLDVVESQGVSNPWAKTLGKIQANPELVEQFGTQVEAYINSIFRKVYEMPLKLTSDETKAIMADITESLVVSRLMATYFRGQPMPQVGSDVSGLASDDRRHAEELIQLYTAGTNIAYPGSFKQANIPGAIHLEPVWLDGESPNMSPQDSITKNYVVLGERKKLSPGDEALGLEWTKEGIRKNPDGYKNSIFN